MAQLYRHFARHWAHVLDFGEDALVEMALHESTGAPIRTADNGYEVGKRWLNVHVAMWRADIASGLLLRAELYRDPELPDWWLDQIL